MRSYNNMNGRIKANRDLLRDAALVRIKRSLEQFLDDLSQGEENPGGFPTLTEIESAAGKLEEETSGAYAEMIREAIGYLDENELVESKKKEAEARGLRLTRRGSLTKRISTLWGELPCKRTYLIPGDTSSLRVKDAAICPADAGFRIEGFPITASPGFIHMASLEAMRQNSLSRACDELSRKTGVDIGQTQFNTCIFFAGKVVCEEMERQPGGYPAVCNMGREIRMPVYLVLGSHPIAIGDGKDDGTVPWFDDGHGGEEARSFYAAAFGGLDVSVYRDCEGVVEAYGIERAEYDCFLGKAEDFIWHASVHARRVMEDRLYTHKLSRRTDAGIHQREDSSFVVILDTTEGLDRVVDGIATSIGARQQTVSELTQHLPVTSEREPLVYYEYSHVAQELRTFAGKVFPGSVAEAERYGERLSRILRDQTPEELIKEIRPYRYIRMLKRSETLYDWLLKNRERLGYRALRDRGFYIGTGLTEITDGVPLSKGLGLGGVHWTPTNARYMLALTAMYHSNRFDEVLDLLEKAGRG